MGRGGVVYNKPCSISRLLLFLNPPHLRSTQFTPKVTVVSKAYYAQHSSSPRKQTPRLSISIFQYPINTPTIPPPSHKMQHRLFSTLLLAMAAISKPAPSPTTVPQVAPNPPQGAPQETVSHAPSPSAKPKPVSYCSKYVGDISYCFNQYLNQEYCQRIWCGYAFGKECDMCPN